MASDAERPWEIAFLRFASGKNRSYIRAANDASSFGGRVGSKPWRRRSRPPAFHPRKGKVSASWRRKETELREEFNRVGCSAEGMGSRRNPVHPATTATPTCTKSSRFRGRHSRSAKVCSASFPTYAGFSGSPTFLPLLFSGRFVRGLSALIVNSNASEFAFWAVRGHFLLPFQDSRGFLAENNFLVGDGRLPVPGPAGRLLFLLLCASFGNPQTWGWVAPWEASSNNHRAPKGFSIPEPVSVRDFHFPAIFVL